MFTSFGDSALMFELVCFVDDVETSGRTKSDLLYSMFAAFKEAGITVAGAAAVTQVALQGEIADAVAESIRAGRV